MELKLSSMPSLKSQSILLIVPYGIETSQSRCQVHQARLLIVPYGIETPYQDKLIQCEIAFNRTLWN